MPIIGVGGVRTGRDALELVAAGASAIQVGTAVFNDPSAPVRVLRELCEMLEARASSGSPTPSAVAHGAAAPDPSHPTTRAPEPLETNGDRR